MSPPEKYSRIASLAGPLRPILIPVSLGFENPRELGRALVAWKYSLNRYEVLLLELIAAGLTNAEIAARMSVAEENTIKQRLRVLFKKLGVRHRVQTAAIAARFGIDGDSR
jgi:DNA-binding NarL/FixJ family response regulator